MRLFKIFKNLKDGTSWKKLTSLLKNRVYCECSPTAWIVNSHWGRERHGRPVFLWRFCCGWCRLLGLFFPKSPELSPFISLVFSSFLLGGNSAKVRVESYEAYWSVIWTRRPSLVSRYFLNTSLSLLMVMGLPDDAAFRLSRRNSSRSFFFRIFTSFSCATGASFATAHWLSLKRESCLG